MNAKIIGIKEFRKNITGFVREGAAETKRLIVMNRNKPLFEVVPFAEDADINDLLADLLQAKKDVDAGRVYSHEEILAELA